MAGLFLGCAMAVVGSCTRATGSSDAVARAFVERFIAQADQRAALPLTAGAARRKVEHEIALLDGQAASAAAERPRIFYTRVGEREQGSSRTVYFRLTVVVIGEQPVETDMTVRTELAGNEWHVTDYDLRPLNSAAGG